MIEKSGKSAHKFGPWTATALVVGNIIGVGVFMLPVSLAPYGWGTALGWMLTLSGAICLAWVFAMLARHLPNEGGAMGIVRVAFGGNAGFVNAWGYWVSVWVGNAIIVIGAVSYLSKLIPALEQSRALSAFTGVGILWLFAMINWRGPRAAGRVQLITSILKLWPFIAAFTVVGLIIARSGFTTLQPVDHSQLTVGAATTTLTLTLYTMLGIECAALPSDAIDNAARVVPRATMYGTLFSGVVNMLLCLSIVLFVPTATVAKSAAPLVEFVSLGLGNTSALIVSLAVVISALGCLNGWVFLAGEIPAAMAEAGELPAWWGTRNQNGAATNAAWVSHLFTTGLVIFNGIGSMASVFTFIVQLATATALLLYILAPLAALRFMNSGRIPRSSALMIAAVGATLFGGLAVIGSGAPAVGWGTLLIAAGWPLYRMMKRRLVVA